MPIVFTYQPPAVNAAAVLHARIEAAELAAAHVLLAASQPLVPVDTGEMQASGRVEHGPDGASVIYERTGADGYNVAARQHEDETLHHDQGQPHFLSDPMHREQAAMMAAAAGVLRA